MSEGGEFLFEARWWLLPRFQRRLWQGMAWIPAGICALMLVASLIRVLFYHEAMAWRTPWDGAMVALPMLFMGRQVVIAVGLEGDELLLRRAFPGRVERVPLARVRHARVTEDWSGTSLRLDLGRALSVRLMTYASRRAAVPEWDGLVAALKTRLEPDERWGE